jgi:hypothetical protein
LKEKTDAACLRPPLRRHRADHECPVLISNLKFQISNLKLLRSQLSTLGFFQPPASSL